MAAEVEKRRIKVRGINLAGKWMAFSRGVKRVSKKSRIPDARRAETAVMRPIRVGAVFKTVRNPRSVPLVKQSKTGIFLQSPWMIMKKMMPGIIISDKNNKKFIVKTTLPAFYNIYDPFGKRILWQTDKNLL